MSRKKAIIKWSLLTIAVLIISVVSFGYWFLSLIPPSIVSKEELKQSQPSDLPYLTQNIIPTRGKILAVVTSTEVMGNSGKSTGYELTELARAYYVFQANGFEVDVASPMGGTPPVVIDEGDMKAFDYAFLNDPLAQSKVSNSIAISDVIPDDYQAIFFVGGKGAMFDFPENITIQSIVRSYYESGKVIGAVCHGPAALVNVTLSNGRPLLANKSVSSFTNEEELFLIPNAEEVFPFLLQSKLEEQGASFAAGTMYLNQVSSSDRLVTGQNPWSTWEAAEAIIEQMGFQPKQRVKTPEEQSVDVLGAYELAGYNDAKEMLTTYCESNPRSVDRELVAIHSLVAAMQLKLGKAFELVQLLSYSNSFL